MKTLKYDKGWCSTFFKKSVLPYPSHTTGSGTVQIGQRELNLSNDLLDTIEKMNSRERVRLSRVPLVSNINVHFYGVITKIPFCTSCQKKKVVPRHHDNFTIDAIFHYLVHYKPPFSYSFSSHFSILLAVDCRRRTILNFTLFSKMYLLVLGTCEGLKNSLIFFYVFLFLFFFNFFVYIMKQAFTTFS